MKSQFWIWLWCMTLDTAKANYFWELSQVPCTVIKQKFCATTVNWAKASWVSALDTRFFLLIEGTFCPWTNNSWHYDIFHLIKTYLSSQFLNHKGQKLFRCLLSLLQALTVHVLLNTCSLQNKICTTIIFDLILCIFLNETTNCRSVIWGVQRNPKHKSPWRETS